MVYRFRIVSDEVDNFSRDIEIDSDSTFFELRNAILDSVGYSKDEMDSFFLCDDGWEKREEITLEDMGSSSDQDIWIMADTPISDLVEEEGQRLIFVFDYLTERSFFMELKKIIPGKTLLDPLCIRKEGNPPAQSVDLAEFEEKIDKTAALNQARAAEDYGDDYFGSDGYNDDDLEGLSAVDDPF
jgi:hypothetical protein